MTTANSSPAPVRRRQFQEGGLLVVIVVLGVLLTIFGGSVKVPKLQRNAAGEMERVFTTNAAGEKELVFEERNKFLNAQSLAQLAKDTSFIAIMAVGATFVIVSGGIDLSVGAIYALASVLGAMVLRYFGPTGPAEAYTIIGTSLGVLTCIGVATFCGLVNGAMIVALRVHPFIITLGTMAIFRGTAFVLTGGQSVGSFPPELRAIVRWETGDGLMLFPSLVMIALAAAANIHLTRRAGGRRIYAVGGNELASRYSGIQVERVKLGVFIFAGLTAGIAAVLNIGYLSAAGSGDGAGYELNVIAAAVVGGASLSGGKGTALGAVLGALIIQMISTGIVFLGIEQNYSQIIIGAVVIVAVLLDQLNNWLMKRRLAAKAGHS